MADEFDTGVTETATVEAKRFAIWKAPAPEVMTLEEARAGGSKIVGDAKAERVYILEIVEVVEPITRIVRFVGK